MEGDRGLKGCIKTTKGPWVVRRPTKRGGLVMKYRFPSERERLNNKERERQRRSVTRNIFRGLKAHGGYRLPKHADSNDLLKAVANEAGWHVEDDGTIYKIKGGEEGRMPGLVEDDGDGGDDDEDYCRCGEEGGGEPDTTLKM